MRRAVNIRGKITSEKVEQALEEQKDVLDGEEATRAHILASLIHQQAYENLEVANHILEGKDMLIDCTLTLVDPQEERSRKVRDRLRQDLLGGGR